MSTDLADDAGDDHPQLGLHAVVRVTADAVTIHVLADVPSDVPSDVHSGGGAPSAIELPIGFATLGRRHLVDDPPLPEQLTNAIGEVLDHLDDATREVPALLEARRVFLEGVVPSVGMSRFRAMRILAAAARAARRA